MSNGSQQAYSVLVNPMVLRVFSTVANNVGDPVASIWAFDRSLMRIKLLDMSCGISLLDQHHEAVRWHYRSEACLAGGDRRTAVPHVAPSVKRRIAVEDLFPTSIRYT
jgi:hypothetical protein